MRTTTLALALLVAPLAAQAEDSPEFLLGDVGVRIDLDSSWKMTRWSDWDFKADKADNSAILVAWATPVQVDLQPSQLDAWGALMGEKAKELGAVEAKVTDSRIATRASDGAKVARIDVEFSTKDGFGGVLRGASTSVKGKTFHMATVGAKVREKAVSAALDPVVERLEVVSPPAAPEGGEVTIEGMKATVPDGWRKPVENEVAEVAKVARTLGHDAITDCWVALRGVANAEPDVLLTCPKPTTLGVVDALNFPDRDAELRKKIFGTDQVPAGRTVALGERTGMVWNPKSGDHSLWVGVVPFGKGITETFAYGTSDPATLEKAVTDTLSSASWEGAHPAALGDVVGYYVRYRPFSPVVLGPALGVLAFLGLAVFLGTRGRKTHHLDDEL